jgi:phenylalanyl-tRNA synthetase beta chain
MKIPVEWLREFIDVPSDAEGLQAFCDTLTMAGLEVEEMLSTVAGPTLSTKITPNRGDWASVYGTAREAAAAGRLALKPLAGTQTGAGANIPAAISVEDADACPRYHATVIRNVKIGPSPAWMQARLTAAGMRPVSNVVDITNYVMLELGQPLHAFDLDTLPGGEIVVRQARAGEKLTTLDGTERALTPGMLCICDRDKPIAIAGIMGGGPTEVTDRTVNLLLESAHFDPLSIRRTAKRLPLATEASYRFERGVDPALAPVAAQRAAALLVAHAGGDVAGAVDIYAGPQPPRRIMARVDRIRKLLGAEVDRDAMIAGLERLGISVERSSGALDCVIPSFRTDLAIEDDIAEEVGRIALGYENLPQTIPPLLRGAGRDSPRGLFTARVRETLIREGLQDVLSHSLTAPSDLTTPDETAHAVRVRSALSVELSSLRASLLPNLLGIASRAHVAGVRDIALFEIGPVYRREDDGAYTEPLRIGGVVAGSAMPAVWSLKGDAYPMDLYFAKGCVEELCAAFGLRDLEWAPGTHPALHPGRTALLRAGGQALGLVGEVSETTAANHDLPRRTYVFDLNGDVLAGLGEDTSPRFTSLPRFPAVVRDIAPVFDRTKPFAEIEATAIRAAGTLLESLRLTDVYSGPNVGEGRVSLTLRFTFRSATGTLKDADVETALNAVRAALIGQGGDLRG